jgi:hypothetical protein
VRDLEDTPDGGTASPEDDALSWPAPGPESLIAFDFPGDEMSGFDAAPTPEHALVLSDDFWPFDQGDAVDDGAGTSGAPLEDLSLPVDIWAHADVADEPTALARPTVADPAVEGLAPLVRTGATQRGSTGARLWSVVQGHDRGLLAIGATAAVIVAVLVFASSPKRPHVVEARNLPTTLAPGTSTTAVPTPRQAAPSLSPPVTDAPVADPERSATSSAPVVVAGPATRPPTVTTRPTAAGETTAAAVPAPGPPPPPPPDPAPAPAPAATPPVEAGPQPTDPPTTVQPSRRDTTTTSAPATTTSTSTTKVGARGCLEGEPSRPVVCP